MRGPASCDAASRTVRAPCTAKGERVKRLKKVLLVSVPLLVIAAVAVFVSGVLPYKVYVLHTGSMTPTIPSKSAVVVDQGHYHVGQVVTFTEDGQTVTHRLISINAAGLITTKGDANATADPWHPPKSQIIGGVVTTMPEVGYWLVYLKSPLGAVSVLLAMLAIWQIWALGSSTPPEAVPTPRQQRARHRRRRMRITF
jgi:signal peptidase